MIHTEGWKGFFPGFFPFITSVIFFVNNIKLLLLAVMGLTRFFLERKRVSKEEITKHAHLQARGPVQAYNLNRVFFSGSLI